MGGFVMRMIVSGFFRFVLGALRLVFGVVFLIAAICVGSTPD